MSATRKKFKQTKCPRCDEDLDYDHFGDGPLNNCPNCGWTNGR